MNAFTTVGAIVVDTKPSDPARLIVTDLCGRTCADVPWDGTRLDVLAGAKALAAEVFGDVHVVGTDGVRRYLDEVAR